MYMDVRIRRWNAATSLDYGLLASTLSLMLRLLCPLVASHGASQAWQCWRWGSGPSVGSLSPLAQTVDDVKMELIKFWSSLFFLLFVPNWAPTEGPVAVGLTPLAGCTGASLDTIWLKNLLTSNYKKVLVDEYLRCCEALRCRCAIGWPNVLVDPFAVENPLCWDGTSLCWSCTPNFPWRVWWCLLVLVLVVLVVNFDALGISSFDVVGIVPLNDVVPFLVMRLSWNELL